MLQLLQKSSSPLTGAELGAKCGVSRQIIVQDIALLRVKGARIMATPQGYLLVNSNLSGLPQYTLATHHLPEEIEDELRTIVDEGGKVIDVIVEHPVYGEIKGMLMLSSREDIARFVSRINFTNAAPLSSLTNGVHLHTVEVKSKKQLNAIKNNLKQKGYLLE